MSYKHLILLAPCHGLEDFPLYHTGEDAASLLAGWTSLWHPALIHSARDVPRIERCDYPPESMERALLVLPQPCEAEMDADLPDAAERQQATLIRGETSRVHILKRALEPLEDLARQIDEELAEDFLALGFTYLQVELLTQQMRYSSSLDQSRIQTAVRDAADAAVAQDVEAARTHLTTCFDALADERNHYYPVDVYLLDLTLLAPTTLGEALAHQLAESTPQNIMASGETIKQLAAQHPQLQRILRQAVDEGRVGLAGGEQQELPLPLMSLDATLRQFEQGHAAYHACLGHVPTTFGRRRNGIFPGLSQVLQHYRFTSALHLTLDEGRCPEANQCKTQWQCSSGEAVEAYARAPLDASLHETFLNLPSQLSDSMDMDHVATRMFAHWPGKVAPWYRDLRRAARYGTVLGKFMTLQDYFAETMDRGNQDNFSGDQYRYPYLKRDVASRQVDPLTRWVRYWHRSANLLLARGALVWRSVLDSSPGATIRRNEWTSLEHEVDRDLSQPASESRIDEQLVQHLTDDLAEVSRRVSSAAAGSDAITVLNALSFPRRVLVDTTALPASPEESHVYATNDEPDGSRWSVVDVPSMGFARLTAGKQQAKPLPGPLLVEDLTLRNEFFQAQIDPTTGALRSLKDYGSRNTRLSQQLAYRITVAKTGQPWVDRRAPVSYSVMAADSVEVTLNGKIRAEITSRGRLVNAQGMVLGQFVQRYQVARGSRVLGVEMELTRQVDFLDDPWDSYFACRFAWADETASLRSGIRFQNHPVGKKRFEAPLFVDIDCDPQHTTVLTGGLPYHRRVSGNQLDTLLLVQGETANRFRLGIGVDLPNATRSAIDFLAVTSPALPIYVDAESGWLFHIDAKNVLATWWEPLEQSSAGFRIRLLETEGRRATVHLRCFRPPSQACVVDAFGETVDDLNVDEGVVTVPMQAYQLRELKVCW